MGIEILNYVYTHTIKSDDEKKIIDDIWKITKCNYYDKHNLYAFNDCDLFVDFNQQLINNNINETLLLIYYFLEKNKQVYINGELFISQEIDIYNVFDKINSYMNPLFEIVIPDNGEEKNLVILTKKNIDSISNFKKYTEIYIYDFYNNKLALSKQFKRSFMFFF
jgi:hypothetical protein